MKKKTALLLVFVMLIMSVFPQFTLANESQQPIQPQTQATSQIKNIIYMIPDGGGYALYDFANALKVDGGFSSSKYPNKTPTDKNPMTLKSYLAGSVTTRSANSSITDSAAAGTALATGNKTNNKMIGINKNGVPVANLVEAAKSVNKATGIVATYEWMHATPASFSAHSIQRDDYKTLYEQIENKGIDVVLGSGYGAVSSYATIQNAKDRGYTVISDKSELKNVKPGQKIWGNMTNSSSPYDINLTSTQPTLAEMTQAAITSLSGDEDGFFLMVEGSKVDTGGHSNDAVVTTSEYIAFDAAVKVAIDYAKGRNDTIVICTPDHDTGGMILPTDMTTAIEQVRNGTNSSLIGWTSTNHTEQNVGIWMYVPDGVPVISGLNSNVGDTASTRSNYVIDNTAIAPYCANLMGVDLSKLSKELFVDVTSIGRYNKITGRFEFASGDKYVYPHKNTYYKDGEELSMNHKLALYLNDKFYVPQDIIEDDDWDYTPESSGEGTKDSPYLINNATDFVNLTNAIASGQKFQGEYFLQTADIDLSTVEGYKGIGSSCTFSGTYDGGNHVINFNFNGGSDGCLFPYTDGVIMNLGTTGYVYGTSHAAGICRSLRTGGVIVNCWSTATAESASSVGGIARTNYGTIANCYFGGTIIAKNSYDVAEDKSGVFSNVYHINAPTQNRSYVIYITESDAINKLADWLNKSRNEAASVTGIDVETLSRWKSEGGYPVLGNPTPVVTGVSVTPNKVTVDKGAGVLLTATVEGTYEPPQDVIWSLEPQSTYGSTVYENGYLYIARNETATSFTVMAKSKYEGSVAGICRVTVGSNVVAEPDGSKSNPYIIATPQDIVNFTNKVKGGEKYSGKYFKQVADINMAGVSGYSGMGGTSILFSGIYDGNGHVINIDIEGTADSCIFPYTDGKIMNLGVTGSVNNTSNAAAICRSVRAGGVMVNCWSTAKVVARDRAGSLARSNYGTIANCYFGGTVSASLNNYGIAENKSGCTVSNVYALENSTGSATAVTKEDIKTTLVNNLNNGRSSAASKCGLSESNLCYWIPVQNKAPVLANNNEQVQFGYANNYTYVVAPMALSKAILAIASYDEDGNIIEIETNPVSANKNTLFITSNKNDYSDDEVVKVMLWQNMVPLAKTK